MAKTPIQNTPKEKFSLDFEKPLRDLEEQLEDLREKSKASDLDVNEEIRAIEKKLEKTKRDVYSGLSPWQKVQMARHPMRPYSSDYIERIFDGFEELHGDRRYRDDHAILAGIARFEGKPVVVIAQQKGRDTKENILRNFGCPDPEGYRKAMRLIRLADKFDMPVFTLVDTPGAYPGIGSEERHVAEAIAVNIRDMMALRVPTISTIIGEGGSGGALGIAATDRVLILQHAYYSVISPEGCAAILWKDRSHASDAAAALKITAEHLKSLGVVDEILSEPHGGAHMDYDKAAKTLKKALSDNLSQLNKLSPEDRLDERYAKYRAMGQYQEDS